MPGVVECRRQREPPHYSAEWREFAGGIKTLHGTITAGKKVLPTALDLRDLTLPRDAPWWTFVKNSMISQIVGDPSVSPPIITSLSNCISLHLLGLTSTAAALNQILEETS